MSLPTSTIPAVLDALLAQLTARLTVLPVDGDPVEVYDGETALLAAQCIQVVGVSNATQEWGATGLSRVWESYDVNLQIRVFAGSDNQPWARARAYLIYGVLLAAPLRDDPGMGGLVMEAEPSFTGLVNGPTDKGGRVAIVPAVVHVDAELA